MKKIAPIRITILLGLAALLPLYILWMLISWSFTQIPFIAVFQEIFGLTFWQAVVPVFLFDILLCYMIGLLVQSSYGHRVREWLEHQLKKIPGFSLLLAIAERLLDKRKKVFGAESAMKVVAFSGPWGCGGWAIGFVTREGKRWSSVAIPTSPVPATGFTQTMNNDDLIGLSMTVMEAVQYVLTFGTNIDPDRIGDEIALHQPVRLSALIPAN
ncbi:MAG: DUF502 domain-containing protein [Candidatus Niyogibacteria bacterium]|nr:DUF502 domain-containing protein [Candidatus Niyogibacteria bacterium]